ncbi:OLC1v1015107C1 [Oldenlandia corymbosa var. corymbosa]|uniref:OLC1v1015107C1 n=1 Tax=Oldenlandia corymbosa var. corymbosa TaxID=529605 RepID=A0AAV1E2N2_OLDCO|nr:OLC1v1015107C1 [Oldenlandia corymbosa var. corymbosa]
MRMMDIEQYRNQNFDSFVKNEEWPEIEKIARSQLVPKFGKKVTAIINACLSEYDAETRYSCNESMLGHIRKAATTSMEDHDLLASSIWDEVPPSRTLITPLQWKFLWNQFLTETESVTIQAYSAPETAARLPEEGKHPFKLTHWLRSLLLCGNW